MASEGPEPTISRVLPDGRLVELVYDPVARTTALAVASADGQVRLVRELKLASGERLVPYSAGNNLIATECVLLPSEVGPLLSKAELLADVRAYLHRYVDLSPLFETIAAHYVLLSWVYDAFRELPYLRFQGNFGTGKTRALIAVGSVCYKPFFASGASTVSPVFHVLEAFRGTLVLDEADFRFSDATASLTKILNNGNVEGLPVLRTMANHRRELNPRAYRVFGPKLIAMRGRFSDPALESRFLTEETGRRPLRPDVPIQLPRELREDARVLRNKLLAWRLHSRRQLDGRADDLPPELTPRSRQVGAALLALVEDAEVRADIAAHLSEQEAGVSHAQRASLDTAVLQALLDVFHESRDGNAPIAAVTEKFNTLARAELGRPMPNRWVGSFLRSRFQIGTAKLHGTYAVPVDQRARATALAAEFGLRPAGAE